jgi:glutamate formiminotransferase / 5-formyltetrahydrofolate cyclo-ligase
MSAVESLVECVPNVSEGRDLALVAELAETIRIVPGVRLLDLHHDADHHRSVFTFVGGASAVAEAAFRLASLATQRIDMEVHRGVHPRFGALDVLPFVPAGETPIATCVALAHEVGERIGRELQVPVYFYGEAARRPERRRLPDVRRGEYEGLREALGVDPDRAPDAGPALLGRAGAVAVGARKVLVAFNVHLRTDDLHVTRAIARALRASSGGLPGVQALAFPTTRPGISQLSMNLVDLDATPMHLLMARVREEGALRGIELAESELVGLMPLSAALDAAAVELGLLQLEQQQIIELG